jgi:hypothetical protein
MAMRRSLTIVPLLSLMCTMAAAVAAPILSVPPAVSRAPVMAKSQGALLLQSATAPLVIALPQPTAAELSSAKSAPTTGARLKPMPIGFGRDVPAAQRTVQLSALRWQGTSEGGRAAQIVVTSPGAAALRIALQMQATDPDVVIRLKGDGAQAKVMGPYPANEIAETTKKVGEWWSPVLEGSSATIEIAVSASVDVANTTLTVSRVSHLMRAGAELAPATVAKATGIGGSGSCEINWVCQSTPAIAQAANAVAKMVFTAEGGDSFLCTGTLLNNTAGTQAPYFFTANHCIDSAYAAQTLNVYWFYDAATCSSPTTPGAYVLQTGGAALLGRSDAEDWALVRLNQPPPGGTTFSAWNAAAITSGPVIDLHHPMGDLKKYSAGALNGQEQVQIDNEDTGDPQINALLSRVYWTQGVTEGGSSGSGLLTYNAGNGWYEVRGGLSGGESSCNAPSSPDYYSRLDQMLPKMRDYLAPGTNAPNEAVVVEYYNKSLDHYFMTQSPIEINDLDTGVFAGWERTGLRFLAYTSPAPGASPVCRFYRAPGYGDSHFYSASPSECSVLVNNPKFPGWICECSNVFYIALPDINSGACTTGTHPMWRFFNTSTTNHRYTDDISVRDTLRADPDWIPEGYGPDAVIMCAPDGV